MSSTDSTTLNDEKGQSLFVISYRRESLRRR